MNELILDGKKYELSPELVEKIKAEVMAQEKAKNPFERNIGEIYYFVDASGGVGDFIDSEYETDNMLYSAGNYCRDKELMKQRALHETLNRLLWRYSETHGGDSNPWPHGTHWFIYGDTANGLKMNVSANDAHKKQGTIYFKDGGTANAAIEEVVKPFMEAHPEFVW